MKPPLNLTTELVPLTYVEALLELAHTIEEMKTICACGRKATCNGRKVNGEFVFEGAQVAIDTVDAVEYQSLCPQCWYREYRAFLKRHPAHQ